MINTFGLAVQLKLGGAMVPRGGALGLTGGGPRVAGPRVAGGTRVAGDAALPTGGTTVLVLGPGLIACTVPFPDGFGPGCFSGIVVGKSMN